jgi:hypothetical protein
MEPLRLPSRSTPVGGRGSSTDPTMVDFCAILAVAGRTAPPRKACPESAEGPP